MSSVKSPWLLLAVAGLCWFASAASSDDKIAVKDLPKAVMATINGRYPKAELTEARKTIEDKLVVYEIDLIHKENPIVIAIFADGKIDWVAHSLPVNDLPKPVVGGIRKKYPGSTLDDASTVYSVKNGKDQLEHYSVELTTKEGKKRSLDVLANGMIEDDTEIKE